MGWSADLIAERRARMEAKRLRDLNAPILPRSSRRHLTALELDHLSEVCNHRTEEERAACSCDCHRKPSTPPLPLSGPQYRLIDLKENQ